jgi:hypothetical protein
MISELLSWEVTAVAPVAIGLFCSPEFWFSSVCYPGEDRMTGVMTESPCLWRPTRHLVGICLYVQF